MFFLFPVSGNTEALSIVEENFIPFLYENPEKALVFAAELNISNGNPAARDFGERYMFGRLVNSSYIYENLEELLNIDEERIIDETVRLLVGPWYNNGNTNFSLVTLADRKIFNFETQKWNKIKKISAIKISHTTEYAGRKRIAYISYDENFENFSILK